MPSTRKRLTITFLQISKWLMANLKDASRRISASKFFLLTYVLSWTIWISLILAASQISEGLSNIVRLFGVLMPAISAIALTAKYTGGAGIRQLFARFKIWRVGGKWWFAAVFIFTALLIASGLIYNLLETQSPVNMLSISIGGLITNIIFLSVASLGEEIGWRGVALPALQKRYSPFISSTILGLLWAAWHLPFWVLIGTLSQFGPVYFVMNFLFIVPTTFFITWFFNRTKGSLLFPVVFHVVFNVVNVAIFPVTSSIGAFGIFIVMQFVAMIVIIPSLRNTKPVEV
jgi:uncharacterized protein